MANIFRAPLYVPKPAEETPWLGRPVGVSAVLIAALIPTFLIQPPQQSNFVPEPGWTIESQSAPLTLTFPPAAPLPFTNPRRFDTVQDHYWQGTPRPTSLLLELAQPPFTAKGTREFNLIPDPDWVHGGSASPLALTLQPITVLPFTNIRREDIAYEVGWVRGGGSVAYPLQIPPQLVLPFSNPRRFDNVPDPTWSQHAGPIPLAMLQLPAIPPFTAKGTRQFNPPDEPLWTMVGKISATIYLPIVVSTQRPQRTLTGAGI